jgi:hypothetical protein
MVQKGRRHATIDIWTVSETALRPVFASIPTEPTTLLAVSKSARYMLDASH